MNNPEQISGPVFLNCDKKIRGKYIVPDGIIEISDSAFSDCTFITEIILPEGVKKIGNFAFNDCKMLTKINIPDTVTEIGHHAFLRCGELTDISLSKNLEILGDYAFSECWELPSISIPNTLKSIGSKSFLHCYKLNIEGESNAYKIKDGVIFENDTLFHCPINKSGEYIIPDGIKKIGDDAFFGCTELTSVVIPETVTEIGMNAFKECINITEFNLPESLEFINDGAFYGCSKLKSVNIPRKISKINKRTFSECKSIKHFNIPDSVTEIGDYAFTCCESLESITVPEGVKSMGIYLFSLCSSLKNVKLPSYLPELKTGFFSDCISLKSVKLPDCLTKIEKNLFYNCKALENIKIPEGVTSIEEYAFYNCEALNNVTFPSSLKSIDEYAFWSCKSIESISLPESLKKLSKYAFANCTSLFDVKLPYTLSQIEMCTFLGCTSLSKINLNNVNRIEKEVFAKCENISLDKKEFEYVGYNAFPEKHEIKPTSEKSVHQALKGRRVMVILSDAMMPDTITQFENVREFLPKTSYTLNAKTVFPPVSLPAMYSLFHSIDPTRHTIMDNYFYPPKEQIHGIGEALRYDGKRIALFYDFDSLHDLVLPGIATVSFSYNGDEYSFRTDGENFYTSSQKLTDDAIKYLNENYVEFAYVYQAFPDYGGHQYGWGSQSYAETVRKSWDNIFKVISKMPDDYIFIITADHGGHYRYHGDNIKSDRTIPVIVYGKGIKENNQLNNINIKDLVPTIADILGTKQNELWEGKSFINQII